MGKIGLKMSLSLSSCFCHGFVLLVRVVFCKHIIHLYSYIGGGDLRHLEVHNLASQPTFLLSNN
jgi:hypothetical protein